MEMIVFCGIQASGKTTYYVQNFLNTHIRISLDLLNTRFKEATIMDSCFSVWQRIVIDNTNPGADVRKAYTIKAREKKYKTICYYFKSTVDESIERNNKRIGKAKVEDVAIFSCKKDLEIPGPVEDFDEIWEICLQPDGSYKKTILFEKKLFGDKTV